MSQNPALTTLWCDNNQLTSLDISQNPALTTLYCYNNQLTTLDLSNTPMLGKLYCENNRLTSLDISGTAVTSFTGSGQTTHLGYLKAGSIFDLAAKDGNIIVDKIKITNGATLTGTVLSGYTEGTPITYNYDVGKGKTMEVTLTFDFSVVTSNIAYKEGNNDFDSGTYGYTPPTTYDEGTDTPLPTAGNIEKEGYTFVGWYDNVDFNGDPITAIDTAAAGDKILYAKFTKKQYTVTFVDMDGNEVATPQTVEYQGTTTKPTTNPTKEGGYRFKGWIGYFGPSTENTTITAEFVKTWNATFYDADDQVIETVTVDERTAATAPAAPTKEGYTFKGWDKEFNNVTENLEVKPIFQMNQYKVTFLNGDGTVLETQGAPYQGTATNPTIDPTKEGGYRFIGWIGNFGPITENTTITAEFVKTWRVIIQDEDKNPLGIVTVDDGTLIANLTPPGKDGYSFVGWENENGTIISDTIVTAKYEPITVENSQIGANLQTAQTGDNHHIVAPLLATGGMSSLTVAFAFVFKKKKKFE